VRIVLLVITSVLALSGCSDSAAVEDAERSVKEDTDRLVDVLEPLCQRQPTCPDDVPQALLRSLSEGNEVTSWHGSQFDIQLCVANDEHDVWAYYHSEYETEVHRGGQPCQFS
jgi:hypothetical protein